MFIELIHLNKISSTLIEHKAVKQTEFFENKYIKGKNKITLIPILNIFQIKI